MSKRCRELIVEAAGKIGVEKKVAVELSKEFEKIKKEASAEGSLDTAMTKILDHGQKQSEELDRIALAKRADTYRNILIFKNLTEIMEAASEATGGKAYKGLEALLVGLSVPFKGAARSIDAAQKNVADAAKGAMLNAIEEAGLLPRFNNMTEDFQRQLNAALSEINGGPEAKNISDEARQLANIINDTFEGLRKRKNSLGAMVNKLVGRSVRQSHDILRMKKAGLDEWKSYIKTRINYKKMGVEETPEEIDRFLNSVYDAITIGVRKNRPNEGLEEFDNLFRFTGPGNLAKRLSHHRLIEFNSPDDFFDYNNKFGTADIRTAVLNQITTDGRSIGLMDRLGTNPEAMLDKVIDFSRRKYGDAGFPREKISTLMAKYKEVSGEVDIPENAIVADVASAIRAQQSLSKLGVASISGFSDVAAMASARHYQGQNIVMAIVESFFALTKTMKPRDVKLYNRMLGVGIDGTLGNFHSRHHAQDNLSGKTAKAMNLFFKLNFLQQWTDSNKKAISLMLSNDFASLRNKKFSELSRPKQRLLDIYDIDEDGWDLIRRTASKLDDGNMYVRPDLIRIPKTKKYAGMSDFQKESLVNKTKDSLIIMLNNEAEIAVPTPGARERAIIRWGHQPGTPAGEAFRTVMQFKSFGITILTKVVGRHTHGAKGQYADLAGRGYVGFATYIAMATALGLASYQAKEIVKGRKPLNAEDPQEAMKLLMAGALQGGGLGLLGDFLFAEYNRFGGGLVDTLGGPSVSTVSDLYKILTKTKYSLVDDDTDGDVSSELINFTKSNLPFANLFYLQSGMNYLVWYQLQEIFNPGYLYRHERTMENVLDREFFIKPSSVVKSGGGFQ